MKRSRLMKAATPVALPVESGWTVDERLGEFRRVHFDKAGNPHIEFVPFSSPEGRIILKCMGKR